MHIDRFDDVCALGWRQGSSHHRYEDRSRILALHAPIVQKAHAGEIFAVFDGVSCRRDGMSAAQKMVDVLVEYVRSPDGFDPYHMLSLLYAQNMAIWSRYNQQQPTAACVGTVALIYGPVAHVFHVGDSKCHIYKRGQIIQEVTEFRDWNLCHYGQGEPLKIAKYTVSIKDFNYLTVSSDGIFEGTNADFLSPILYNPISNEHIVRNVLNTSIANGSSDDLTFIVIDLDELQSRQEEYWSLDS
jgi:serine/threonine protein phosphatase PrpC